MNNDNGNETAFPFNYNADTSHGLTKRELFAAMAMQGLLSAGRTTDAATPGFATGIADALLLELSKQQNA